MAFIEARNAEDHPYKLGVTAFADLTPEEFSDYLGYRHSAKDTCAASPASKRARRQRR